MKRLPSIHAPILGGLLFVFGACGKSNETSFRHSSQVEDRVDVAELSSMAVAGGESSAQLIVQLSEDHATSEVARDVSSQEAIQGLVLAPPADLPKMRPIPRIQVAYDYQGVLSRAHSTAGVVRMIVQSGPFVGAKLVQFTGTLVNLNNSKITVPISRLVSVTNGNVIDFTVDGLAANTVYRLEGGKITDASVEQQQVNPAVATMQQPYHLVTAADDKLSQARRRLVLRALSESYDWDYGNYLSSKGYASGSWCDRFYTWAVGKDFRLSSPYSAKTFFYQYKSLGNASRIPSMAKSESVMGDLIRYEGTSLGTHTLMIVSYDEAIKSIWTVEGNFNNRVMRLKRGISSGWMHGHLVEAQVKEQIKEQRQAQNN